MAHGEQSAISARSRSGGPSHENPAEAPGPDVGLLVEHDLPEGPRLVLVYLPGLRALEGTPQEVRTQLKNDPWPVMLGYLRLAAAPKTIEDPRERRCGNVYVVRSSWAQPGWGPLLYDAGLAMAHFDGLEGVVPDRGQVSSSAERLWWHYNQARRDVGVRPVPADCPHHGVGALDAVYSAGEGFPGVPVGILGSQMEQAVRSESRRLGLSQADFKQILADGAIEAAGLALFAPPPALVRRARANNPGFWMEGTMPNQRKAREKPGFWAKKRDWDEVLVTTPTREITRGEIRDYFADHEDEIFPYLKGQTVMVLFAPSKDYFLYKRHVPGPKGAPKKTIKITKRKGIEDPSSYEYWINRRVVEFHRVIGSKTRYVWVDIDPHPRDHDPQLVSKMEAAVPKVVEVLRAAFPKAQVEIWSSGKRGIHVEGYLPQAVSTDNARKVLRKGLDAAFASDPTFVTGLARPGQIRLDVTTLKRTGSIRAPYSFSVGGQPKVPYRKGAPSLLARFTARVKKAMGRAANPLTTNKEAVVAELDKRVATFRELLAKRMGKERYTVRAHVVPASANTDAFYAVVVEVEVPREHRCQPALCGAGKGPIDRCERTIMEAFRQSGLDQYLEFDGTDYGPICPEDEDCPTPERGYHFYESRPSPVAALAANALKRRLLK